MQDFNEILLSQVKDISGLERVPSWPWATGWWLVVFIFVSFLVVLLKKFLQIRSYKKSWRYKLEKELDQIAEYKNTDMAKQNISRINEILKRLAIHLYGRKNSASLVGKKWLAWLSNRDPNNFNWAKKGKILINYPYMKPQDISVKHKEVAALANAAKEWLKLC